MKLITQSRLFGVLLITASMSMDPGVALAVNAVSTALESAAPGQVAPAQAALETRMQRIAAAVRQGQAEAGIAAEPGAIGDDEISFVVLGSGGIGWSNGGWGNGGFYNGGFNNGGFNNGGFYNGGFRNGGFGNGGYYNDGFRNNRGGPNGW